MANTLKRYGFAIFLLVIGFVAPVFLEPFDLVSGAMYVALAIGGLGLAFVWGTCGILSLGHSVFFGLGAYAYAVTAINQGDSTVAAVLALVVPVVLSLVLGYFLFYSRLGDVYLAVITLCVTLILFSFATSTADPFYHIGSVELGGFNGINGAPGLNVPGHPDEPLSVTGTFITCMIVLVIAYVLLTFLRSHRIGQVMTAVRENELRTELLGYDVRIYKLAGYAVSAAVAGLSGALYTAVSGYVGPNAFDLAQASQFVLWVIAGGLGTLAGPIVASICFQMLASFLGTSQIVNVELVFGAIVIAFVLLLPQGVLPWVLSWRAGTRLGFAKERAVE